MKKQAFILLAIAGIISCSAPKKEIVLKVKLQKLKEGELYKKDLVYDVLFDAQEMNVDSLQKESRKLFLQGIDLYKNKKKPADAVKLFISSILIFPDAKTYYELGNALMDADQGVLTLNESLKAMEVAEHLNFQPISNVYYKMARAKYFLHKKATDKEDAEMHLSNAVYSLEKAYENGFSDSLSIKNDGVMGSVIATSEYRSMIRGIKVKLKNIGRNSLFDLFVNSFPLTTGSLAIPVGNVEMKDCRQQSISYDFADFIPEMENTSFGREVSHEYFYVAVVGKTPAYTALVYSSVSFWEESMQPVNTSLVTYSPEGKIIARKIISCSCSAEKVKSCKLDGETITIEEYKRTWEQPIDKVPFYENKVKSNELIAKASFRINEAGLIQDLDVPKTFNDSEMTVGK